MIHQKGDILADGIDGGHGQGGRVQAI
jgi:hypothetical protein